MKEVRKILDGKLQCANCKEFKEPENYFKSNRNKDGFVGACKKCKKEYTESLKTREKHIHENDLKLCKKCNIIKNTTLFYISNTTFDGLNCRCKDCVDEYYKNNKESSSNYSKQWRLDNLERSKANAKLWQENNKEYIREQNKIYREANKHILSQKYRAYIKNRLENDTLFKLTDIIRKRIKSTFKQNLNGKFSKSVLTENILGYDFHTFKNHIESQLLNWMSWDNYGNVCEILEHNCSWDLDHIIPVSYAQNEEELYLLNHWSNFQPLCSKVNRDEKKAKIQPCTNLELGITFWQNHYEYINKDI